MVLMPLRARQGVPLGLTFVCANRRLFRFLGFRRFFGLIGLGGFLSLFTFLSLFRFFALSRFPGFRPATALFGLLGRFAFLSGPALPTVAAPSLRRSLGGLRQRRGAFDFNLQFRGHFGVQTQLDFMVAESPNGMFEMNLSLIQ